MEVNEIKLNEKQDEWSEVEIAALIKGVFKYGENEWSDLIEDLDVINEQRTPN